MIQDDLKLPDQNILNILFQNDCKILDQKFNVQYGQNNVILRHFVNIYKPWKCNYFLINNKPIPLKNFDDFWKYAKMTEFYKELKENYEKNINSNILNKRFSAMVEKMRDNQKI